jgi:hypothetical protein
MDRSTNSRSGSRLVRRVPLDVNAVAVVTQDFPRIRSLRIIA